MCGLVGIAGDIGYKGQKFFKRLLELDTYRGPHSTGVLAVDNRGETAVQKHLGTPWDFFENRAAESLLNKAGHKVLLGHNRWATKGKINRQNAHPFEFDTVVGAHNGTLTSVYNLDDYQDFDVDSENIYHHMDKNGVYETIPKLNGAFALTWYDKLDATVNLIRNNERTLFYAISNDRKTIAWASEAWMIIVAAQQAGIDFGEPQDVPVGVLHTFEVPMGVVATAFEKVRLRKLELYKAPLRVVQSSTSSTSTATQGGNTAKVKRPFSEYQKYVGKECSFFVGNVGLSRTGQSFIQCWACDDSDISIRVFAAVDGDLWKKLMDSTNFFKGLAKSYTGCDNGYLTIDLRTIEEFEDAGNDAPAEVAVGFENEELSEKEFSLRTAKGCAWCACPVLFTDHPNVVWFAKRDFLCPDCGEQEDPQIYINQK